MDLVEQIERLHPELDPLSPRQIDVLEERHVRPAVELAASPSHQKPITKYRGLFDTSSAHE
jgi:hypothetical protein